MTKPPEAPPKPKSNGTARWEGALSPSAGPPEVEELAKACERFVLARYKVQLDRTPETLSLLDQYVRDARAAATERPETVPLVRAAVGAYFGEVVRGAFDARWFCEGLHDGWRLDFVRVFLTFNPMGVAHEALLLASDEAWHAHLEMDEAEREAVERRLAKLGEVDAEEFYAPTTRFEVLEIAVDALRASMLEHGLSDVTFGSEDYRHK